MKKKSLKLNSLTSQEMNFVIGADTPCCTCSCGCLVDENNLSSVTSTNENAVTNKGGGIVPPSTR